MTTKTESRVSLLRESLSSASVLQIELMKTKKINPLVFVFEGVDDFTYYEQAIKHCSFSYRYEHIVAKGKEQINILYNKLLDTKNHNLLKNTFFFVDQDYDNFSYITNSVFNLDVYAIENCLYDHAAIESILIDELKLHGEKAEKRNYYLEALTQSYNNFVNIMRDYSHYLFVCKNNTLPQEYPSLSPYFINVSHSTTIMNRELKRDFSPEYSEIVSYPEEFLCNTDHLNDSQIIRGKYVFWFIKKWIMAVKEDINNNKVHSEDLRLSDDFITIRRLSQNCCINNRLFKFLDRIGEQMKSGVPS